MHINTLGAWRSPAAKGNCTFTSPVSSRLMWPLNNVFPSIPPFNGMGFGTAEGESAQSFRGGRGSTGHSGQARHHLKGVLEGG